MEADAPVLGEYRLGPGKAGRAPRGVLRVGGSQGFRGFFKGSFKGSLKGSLRDLWGSIRGLYWELYRDPFPHSLLSTREEF